MNLESLIKTVSKNFLLIVAGFLFILFAGGCSDGIVNNTIVPASASYSDSESEFTLSEGTFLYTGPVGIRSAEGEPTSGNNADPGQYGRVYATTGTIGKEGGTLHVGFTVNNGRGNHPTQTQVKFEVPPGALPQSITLTMTVKEYNLETGIILEMGPSGTRFDTPAFLNINTLNYNVANITTTSGSPFYCVDDGVAGKYESINVNPSNGKFTLIKGHVNHFSRYAFAYVKK